MDNKSGAAIVYESVPFNVSLVLIADSMGVLNYAKRPLEMPENTAYYYGLLLVQNHVCYWNVECQWYLLQNTTLRLTLRLEHLGSFDYTSSFLV